MLLHFTDVKTEAESPGVTPPDVPPHTSQAVLIPRVPREPWSALTSLSLCLEFRDIPGLHGSERQPA